MLIYYMLQHIMYLCDYSFVSGMMLCRKSLLCMLFYYILLHIMYLCDDSFLALGERGDALWPQRRRKFHNLRKRRMNRI